MLDANPFRELDDARARTLEELTCVLEDRELVWTRAAADPLPELGEAAASPGESLLFLREDGAKLVSNLGGISARVRTLRGGTVAHERPIRIVAALRPMLASKVALTIASELLPADTLPQRGVDAPAEVWSGGSVGHLVFRDRVFTKLERARAKALVEELQAILDRAASSSRESGELNVPFGSEAPAELSGLSVVSAFQAFDDSAPAGAMGAKGAGATR